MALVVHIAVFLCACLRKLCGTVKEIYSSCYNLCLPELREIFFQLVVYSSDTECQ